MKLMSSPTVLMLASSSSGMATPNLSSTAVAISTIDTESTSTASLNDFFAWAAAAGVGRDRLLGSGVRGGHPAGLLQDLGEAGLDLLGAAHAAGPLSRMGRGGPAVVPDVVCRGSGGVVAL